MATPSRCTLLLALAACGFPRPADVGGESGPSDADVSVDAGADGSPVDTTPIDAAQDAPDPPGTVLHVSPSGDDANDGLTKPVKTLKHAIGLAAQNNQITTIVLAAGRYATAAGETFPYTVPANVTIVGPAGGGAILAGTKTEIGMMVDAGKLQDLELEDFSAAIVAIGVARLANIHVRTSVTAVRAETTARLTVDNLDITGAVGACAAGMVLNGAADLAATIFATRGLGTALEAKNPSTINLAKANITGDPTCTQTVIVVTTGQTFVMSDSVIDGGNNGIRIDPQSLSVHVNITNSIVRNLKLIAVSGGANSGGSVTFKMQGGEISGNQQGGVAFGGGGSWTFNNVTLTHNAPFGIDSEGGTLIMRNCSIVNNSGFGVSVVNPIAADLGTVTDPGNNILQNNAEFGLDYGGGTAQVEAVGNTWNPRVQGADDLGKYVPAILQGPINGISHDNYFVSCDTGQCTLHR